MELNDKGKNMHEYLYDLLHRTWTEAASVSAQVSETPLLNLIADHLVVSFWRAQISFFSSTERQQQIDCTCIVSRTPAEGDGDGWFH